MERLSPKLVQLLNKQIKNELDSSRLYRAVGEWCDYEGYFASAKLFKKYGEEEIIHQDKIYSYLQDRDYLPETPMADAQKRDYGSLKEVYQMGLEHEDVVESQWKAIYKQCEEDKDYTSCAWSQWFLLEQIEEVSKFISLLDKLDKCGEDKIGIQLFEEYVEELLEG
jgi:ferritin